MPDPADRDLLAELGSLSTPGLTMDPLPASEVRRRGARMRRRQHVIATVGAVAALAAIATPIAMAVDNDTGRRTPEPAAPPDGWTTTIPDDFPIRDGFPTPAETRAPAYGAIPNCGGWPSERSRDDLAVHFATVEHRMQRWLAVYPDAATAAAELDALRDATTDCDPVPAGGGSELFFGSVATPAGVGAEDAYSYTEQSREPDGLIANLTLVTVYRTGNALLYENSFGTAGGDVVIREELARRTDATENTVEAMCVFSIEGCPPAEPDPHSGSIPDDFPLLDGYPTVGSDSDSEVVGPTRALGPLTLDVCGTDVEVPEHLDQLRSGFHSEGDDRERLLVTFSDEQQAQAYLRSVIAAYRDCPKNTPDGRTRWVQTLEQLSSYDAGGGAHISWERDGEPVPGVETTAVIRMGQAVLLSNVVIDQTVGPRGERIQAQTRAAFDELEGVVAAMGD